MSAYAKFLAGKAARPQSVGHEPTMLHPSLYPFQRDITRWAVRRGRAAIFADCGMGKTRMQLEWARQIRPEGGRVLIVCPLAVAEQTQEEATLVGMDVVRVTAPGDSDYQITNYQRLHHFVGAPYDALILDESSILKSIDGKTRTMLLREFTAIKYRLACTATPAPNDLSELANHSEFVGAMPRVEMLAAFFVHDGDGGDSGKWRLKGHAEDAFWRWVASWAVYVRRPSDVGDDDGPFVLPALDVSESVVASDFRVEGSLFGGGGGLAGERAARKHSLRDRVERTAALIEGGDGQAIVWCGLNDEGRLLAQRLGPSALLIEGATDDVERESLFRRWRNGEAQTFITKPSMFGFGLNLQFCWRVFFLGIGHSYEQYYQAVRRCWRFGQASPVDVRIVVSEAELGVAANVRRKEQEAAQLAEGIVMHMKGAMDDELHHEKSAEQPHERDEAQSADWRLLLGDSVERISEVPDASVGLSVFSPPFAALYTYSANDRDMGNSKETTTKAIHGVIGWRDFRADVVAHFVKAGWVYDGEVVIDKDPQAQAIRTKSKALMFVQKNKDSAWSRPAMADYVLLFRAPGDNPTAVDTDVSNEEWILWARPIWYGIRESETLNAAEAREDKDERHLCPLQLETIERCVRLWSNKGEWVLDPFAGIGSTGYVALKHERRFVGIELKRAYWKQAVRNVQQAQRQLGLFVAAPTDEATA